LATNPSEEGVDNGQQGKKKRQETQAEGQEGRKGQEEIGFKQ
jgi:hypothetical protein